MIDTADAPMAPGPTVPAPIPYSLSRSRLRETFSVEHALESHIGQAPSATATHIGPSRTGSKMASFFAKSAFQGVVTEIDRENETFSARLWRMPGYVPEAEMVEAIDADASFPIESLARDDLPLLALGSVFTWLTGYREGPGAPREWISNLHFRRLPRRSERELQFLEARSDAFLAACRT
jgi:hypothetical protein